MQALEIRLSLTTLPCRLHITMILADHLYLLSDKGSNQKFETDHIVDSTGRAHHASKSLSQTNKIPLK